MSGYLEIPLSHSLSLHLMLTCLFVLLLKPAFACRPSINSFPRGYCTTPRMNAINANAQICSFLSLRAYQISKEAELIVHLPDFRSRLTQSLLQLLLHLVLLR